MTGTTADRSRSLLGRLGHDTLYVFAEFPLSLLRFCVLLPMAVAGIGMSIIGIGIPILLGTLAIASALARFDRVRLAANRGRELPRPTYRTNMVSDFRHLTDLRTVFRVLLDPMRLREWLHGVASLPVAMATFLVAFAWWTLGLAAATSPLYAWSMQGENETIADLLGFDSLLADNLVNLTVGLAFLLTLPLVMRGLAGVHAGFSGALLTPRRVELLESRVTELAESRDAAVSAETDSLRRLERDIHDGPQQRLVRLAMDLSTVQRRLGTDPDSARPLVEEALQQTRETLDELRALSRGIAPPILTDRGLSAALAALAARSPVRTEIEIDLPEGVRLGQTVENAAYFVCAEALANVAKHSQASQCTIAVSRSIVGASGTLVHVFVTDDGIGGAHLSKGHGIAGLADRVRALGGTLQVESPLGGPTVVSAEIPCES